MVRKSITMRGVFTVDSPAYRRAIRLLESGAQPFDRLHTASYPLERAEEAIHHLATGEAAQPPQVAEVKGWLLEHLDDHYRLYGEFAGVRSARKHIGWTLKGLPGGEAFRAEMNAIESCEAQARAVTAWFDRLADAMPRMPLADESGGDVARFLH